MSEPLVVNREQAGELALIHRLFTSPDGARWLAMMVERFCRRRSFVEGDPYATAFRDGQRDPFEQILDALKMAETPMMIEELDEVA